MLKLHQHNSLASAGLQDGVCDLALLKHSSHAKCNTSFWVYKPEYFDDEKLKKARKILLEEDDGRMVIDKAKNTESGGLLPAVPPLNKPGLNKGDAMPEDTKWKKGQEDPPPVSVADLWKYTSYKNMQRAKEAAVISDNALLEAQKQQEAARYHSQQALMYEAAALRSLRHGGKDSSRTAHIPHKLKINEYPVPPDTHWSSQNLLAQPGWETPGAAQVPMHGPLPMNAFRISTADIAQASVPWCVATFSALPSHAGQSPCFGAKLPHHARMAMASFL
jgi:hypothetical protein